MDQNTVFVNTKYKFYAEIYKSRIKSVDMGLPKFYPYIPLFLSYFFTVHLMTGQTFQSKGMLSVASFLVEHNLPYERPLLYSKAKHLGSSLQSSSISVIVLRIRSPYASSQ